MSEENIKWSETEEYRLVQYVMWAVLTSLAEIYIQSVEAKLLFFIAILLWFALNLIPTKYV